MNQKKRGDSHLQSIIQIILSNLYLIGVLSLMTLGVTLTYKTAKIVNFSQAITSTMGIFIAAYLASRLGANLWLSLVIGIVACFIVGWLFDLLFLRHASGEGAKVMVTLGLIILITAIIPIIFGMIPYDYFRFFSGNIDFKLFGMALTVTKNGLFSLAIAAAVTGAIFIALYFTKWGLGIRATASNRDVAAMMGINTKRLIAFSWAISGAVGALGGILYASQTSNVQVDMLGTIWMSSLLAFILGGYNSFYGPTVGAVMIPIILSMAALVSGLWSNAILYAIILLAILIKPEGLFGKATAKKV